MSAGTCALTGAAREGGGAVFSTKNAQISKKIEDFLRNEKGTILSKDSTISFFYIS